MIELLKGPKGTITEGLIPLITVIVAMLWFFYANMRRRKGESLEIAKVLSVFILIFLVGFTLAVAYPIWLEQSLRHAKRQIDGRI